MRLLVVAAALFGVIVTSLSACPRTIGKVGCEDPRDCDPGDRCAEGQCVPATSCTLDSECTAPELCINNVCSTDGGNNNNNNGACTSNATCPITQFCNTQTGVCAELLSGWCRTPSQCTAEAPVCSAATEDDLGRCVECVTNTDCRNGAQCVHPGVCSTVQCPQNATPVNNVCTCNPGFVDDGAGGCQPSGGGGAGGGGAGGGGAGGGGAGGGGAGGGGDPGPACDENLGALCVLAGPYNDCQQGVCVCDGAQLLVSCGLQELIDGVPNTPNPSTCLCDVDTPAEGEGEGEGEGDPPPLALENQPCGAVQCDFGLECVITSGTSGVCKRDCVDDFDCDLDETCLLSRNGLGLPSGAQFCARARTFGQTCQGAADNPTTWQTASDICYDTLDVIDCFSGTCEQVCATESGQQFGCPSGQVCGPLQARPEMSGARIAVCL